jgi:hypothetical protein
MTTLSTCLCTVTPWNRLRLLRRKSAPQGGWPASSRKRKLQSPLSKTRTPVKLICASYLCCYLCMRLCACPSTKSRVLYRVHPCDTRSYQSSTWQGAVIHTKPVDATISTAGYGVKLSYTLLRQQQLLLEPMHWHVQPSYRSLHHVAVKQPGSLPRIKHCLKSLQRWQMVTRPSRPNCKPSVRGIQLPQGCGSLPVLVSATWHARSHTMNKHLLKFQLNHKC